MNDVLQTDASSCKQVPGAFAPVIDRNRCEGKGDCVAVCPRNVFVLGVLPAAEHPCVAPQLNWTLGVVLNDKLSCVTSRAVENSRIETANPPSMLVLTL